MNINIKIDSEKISSFLKRYYKYLPIFVACFIIIIFSVLTYFVLYPGVDNIHVAEGEAKVQTLDIRFNTKLLNELGATKTPTQLGTTGGRDPFSGF